MVENLGKANARRRDYLKYREKHRGKLARVRSADAVPDEAIGGIEERLGPAKSSADGLSVFEQSATFSIAPASSMNDTKATTFIAPSLATVDLEDWNITDTRSEDGRSETSYATSTGETGSNALSVPPPPVALDAESPFECPYCYMIQCPSSWSEWKYDSHSLQVLLQLQLRYHLQEARLLRSSSLHLHSSNLYNLSLHHTSILVRPRVGISPQALVMLYLSRSIW